MRVDTREFLSSLTTLLIGAGVLWEASRYSVGNLYQMGPGFFPTALGWLLIGAGGLMMVVSFKFTTGPLDEIRLRPLLFVLVSVVVFGLTIEPYGIIVATSLLVILARLAQPGLPWLGTLLLLLVLSAMVYVIFIAVLGIPFRVFPWR